MPNRPITRERPIVDHRRPMMEPLEARQLLSSAPVDAAGMPDAASTPPAVIAAAALVTDAAPVGDAAQDTDAMQAGDGPLADTTPPQLIGQQLLGSLNRVTGIVLTFSEPLDPAAAQDTDAYIIFKRIHHKGEEGGLLDEFVPFLDTSTGASTSTKKLRLDAALYDDAARTVTVIPHHPFRAKRLLRQLRVMGKGQHAVKDAAGNLLDGDADGLAGQNALVKFNVKRGRTVNFKEADGDRVTVRLHGPGSMASVVHRRGTKEPLIFVTSGNAAKTTLRATIRPGKAGDGAAYIPQVTGLSSAQVAFLNDPSFTVGLTQP